MRIQKRWLSLLLAMLLLPVMSITVFAHAMPDSSEKGSISITMACDGKTVSGGTLMLYLVGAITEENGNYIFSLTGDFIESGADLTDISTADLAKELKQYAENHSLSGEKAGIGKDGKATFSELNPGLYLIVQNEAAAGYHRAKPFLVSVPMNENGIWIYTVDASPKVELKKKAKSTPVPTVTETDTTTPTPTALSTQSAAIPPAALTLPQTGQLNWPVPVLAVMGMVLFAIGWLLRFEKKRGDHEK